MGDEGQLIQPETVLQARISLLLRRFAVQDIDGLPLRLVGSVAITARWLRKPSASQRIVIQGESDTTSSTAAWRAFGEI
jgi:hypothetical protein